MGKYTEVKSNYIKKEIKKADWRRDLGYINDLIDIEQHILGKKSGLGIGYMIKALEEKYPKEYKEIYKELKPKVWERIQRENKKEAKKEKIEEEKNLEFEKSLAQKEKEDWVKAKKRLKEEK